jgi:dTDP-4-dehydrorhamnose reductase
MIRVIVFGASGMLGSMVVDVLSRDSALAVTGTVRGQSLIEKVRERLPAVDWCLFDACITNSRSALEAIDGHEWVVNAIGITKPLIHNDNAFEVERAIWINSMLPHLIGARAAAVGACVLQIATDCVYSGAKGPYLEMDPHDALDVYGKTKSLGESIQTNVYHLRCSIIGPEPKEYKFLLEWFRRQPHEAQVNGYVNHLWNGVTTLHFARICQGIIKSSITFPHLQHIVPTGVLTKAQMLREFAIAYNRKDIQIMDVEAKDVIDRTLSTNYRKVNRLLWEAAGYDQPPTVSDMITELSQYDYQLSELA